MYVDTPHECDRISDVGQVNDPKAAYTARAASLAAGVPVTAGANSVNRFCSSGLKAVQDIANQISCGSIDCGIAIGAESMSAAGSQLEPFHEAILQNQESADCLQPMGQTSENVGKDFDISRDSQDRFAAESYRRAEEAQKSGWFEDEIYPFVTKVKDPKTGEEREVTLSKDEGPRWGTTLESLQKIKPAFPQYGDKSTGGNSSQITDGGKTLPVPSVEYANRCLVFSCRHPFNETLQSSSIKTTHPRQIRRRHSCRRSTSDYGYRSLNRYS